MPFYSDDQRRWYFATHPQGPHGAAIEADQREYFHGTGAEFDEFRDPDEGKGIWFTSNREDAERYAALSAKYGGRAHVVSANVRLIKDGTARMAQLHRLSTREAIKRLKAEGFDGFRDGDNVVVFYGKNVRMRSK